MIRIICVFNINYDIIIYDMITYDLFKQSSLEKWPKLYCQQYRNFELQDLVVLFPNVAGRFVHLALHSAP